MMFEKILQHTDLSFDIALEKAEYRPSEIVRGTVRLKTEKGAKVRKLALFAEGKESTIIRVSETRDTGKSTRDTDTRTYSEVNTFFSHDLSDLLQKSVGSNLLQDGTIEILPQNKVIAFEFALPADNNLSSSYKGKHVKITYTVKAIADIAKKVDVNKEEQFQVMNTYNNKTVFPGSNISFNKENKSDTIIQTPLKTKTIFQHYQ